MSKNKPPAKLFKNDAWNICYSQFIASLPSLGTQQQYNWALKRFFAFTEKTPDKITRREIETYLHQPLVNGKNAGKPRSAYTYNTICLIIKSFYSWCAEYLVEYRGKQQPILRGSDPTRGIKLAKLGETDRDIEEDEIARFLDQIDRSTLIGKRDYALFLCLVSCGKRRAEITRLRWGNLLFMKNGTTRYSYKAKGRVSLIWAEMPPVCMDAIRDLLESLGEWGNMQPEDPIFHGIERHPNVGEPMALIHVDSRFRIYANAAGLPANIVVHSLRHAHAWSRYQENGHDILDVRDALDHKTVKQSVEYIEKQKRKVRVDPVGARLAARFARS